MTDFIINPLSISFESIKNDLSIFLSKKPDASSWQDFFTSGAGETVVELCAALGAFYAYEIIVGRRELFMSCAQNSSSLIALAQNNSYSVSRGNNLKVTLTVLPTATTTISKWDIIGVYQDYDIVAIEDAVLNSGIQSTISVVIGNFTQESITIQTNLINQFRFTSNNVSNDIRLLLNSTELPVSIQIKDLLSDYYYTRSNPLGAIDVYYLQDGSYNYKVGDILNLQFIESSYVDFNSMTESEFVINDANVISFSKYSDYTAIEDNSSIALKASLARDLASVIKSRADYHDAILLDNASLLHDTNSTDITPGLINVSCIKDDHTYLSISEIADIILREGYLNPGGVANIIITHPVEISKEINILVTKLNSTYLDDTLQSSIDTLKSTYEYEFEKELSLDDFEYAVERLTGVRKCRPSFISNVWQNDTFYSLYDIVDPSDTSKDIQMYVQNFIYKTDSIEPTWPSEYSILTTDNRIIWQRVDEYIDLAVLPWQADTEYSLYEYIRPVDVNNLKIFKAVGFINYSGNSEPTWNTDIGDITCDNEIIWKTIEYTTGIDVWAQNENYNIADIVKSLATPTTAYCFQCIGFRSISGNSEPTWNEVENGFTEDSRINWTTKVGGVSNIQLQWNEYFKITTNTVIET